MVKSIKFHVFSKRYIPICVVVAVFFALSLLDIRSWATVDEYQYFSGIQKALSWKFVFSSNGILRLCSHQSYLSALWYVAGAGLTNGGIVGIRLTQVFLQAAATIAFYFIALRVFAAKGIKEIEAALLTAVYSLNPPVLGLSNEISLDVMSASFLVLITASYLYEKPFLFLFLAVNLAFCKESNLFILLGIGCGIIICATSSRRMATEGKRIFPMLSPFDLSCGLSLVLAAISCVIALKGGLWGVTRAAVANFNQFAFNSIHVSMLLKEVFFLNFSWVLWAVVIAGIAIWVIEWRHDNRREEIHNEMVMLLPLTLATGFYLLFLLAYLTYCLPRYLLPIIPSLVLAAWIPLQFAHKRFVPLGGLCVVAVLFLVETFWTVDPVSLGVFKTFDVGSTTLISTRAFYGDDPSAGIQTDDEHTSIRELGAGSHYNRQHVGFGYMFDEFLSDIKYDSDTLIILDPVLGPATHEDLFSSRKTNTTTQYFDELRGGVTLSKTDIPLNCIIAPSSSCDLNLSDYREYKRIIFISFPYRQEYYAAAQPIRNLAIIHQGDFKKNGWSMTWYLLKDGS